jgi:opacity protein-like surface antigen
VQQPQNPIRHAWALLLGLLIIGCAKPPGFIRRDARLNSIFYRPKTRPYMANPNFSLEMDLSWKGPTKIPGGVRYSEKNGRAAIAVAYIRKGLKGYRTPTAFRQYMREQGTVLDSHILSTVEISSRVADMGRWTTYRYTPGTRLGERKEVNLTQMLHIADPQGVYIVAYEASRRNFPTYHGVFKKMLKTLTLPELGKRKIIVDPLGLQRNKEVKSEAEERKKEWTLELERQDEHFAKSKRRWLFGLGVGGSGPAGRNGNQNPRILPGPALALHILYYAQDRLLLGGGLSYEKFGKRNLSSAPPIDSAAEGQALSVSMLGRINLRGDSLFSPYVLGGVGVHQYSLKVASSENPVTGVCAAGQCVNKTLTSLGLTGTAALGVESFFSPVMSVFTELRYRYHYMDGKDLKGAAQTASGQVGFHYRFRTPKFLRKKDRP